MASAAPAQMRWGVTVCIPAGTGCGDDLPDWAEEDGELMGEGFLRLWDQSLDASSK